MASVCHFYVVICGFITTGWAQKHNDVTPVLGCEDAQVGHQNVTAGKAFPVTNDHDLEAGPSKHCSLRDAHSLCWSAVCILHAVALQMC